MVARCSITKDDAYLRGRKSKYWKLLPFKIKGYSVYLEDRYPKHKTINIYDNRRRRPVMQLELGSVTYNDISSYHVDSAYVDQRYQGKKIGFELYQTLITQYQISLLTVGSHSRGARKLWNDLSLLPSISAYGIKADGSRIWKLRSNRKKRELKSTGKNPPVYTNREGIGIFLTLKDSSTDLHMKKMIGKKQKPKDILRTKSYEFLPTIYA